MGSVFLESQLEAFGLCGCSYEILQDKAGVTVARVYNGNERMILKCFEDIPSRREIENYRLLSSMGVPVLKIYAFSEAALLMEDMAGASAYRLAAEADMNDAGVAEKLAMWYRNLHDAGFLYVKEHGAGMYSESDMFSFENIARVKQMSRTESNPVWNLIEKNFDSIRRLIDMTPMTVTYNDFYYTNMAVARDGSSALMFDYNLLGKGHVYSDIRNVLSSLSAAAGESFVSAYGKYDAEKEKRIDDVISPVVTLFMAYNRDKFPKWAEPSLMRINNGYAEDIERLIEII